MFRVCLTTTVNETMMLSGDRYCDTEVGFWTFARVIEYPCKPRKKVSIVTHDADGDEVFFRVRRVVWDADAVGWIAYGDLCVMIPHESTPEKMRQMFPGWEIEWIDNYSFDGEGNFLPAEERSNHEEERR